MNSTIPLLGGVPLCGGEGVFRLLMFILKKRERKIYKKMRSSRLRKAKPQDAAPLTH
jgi:hypothetical protein